jgi:hypothetical protein
MEWYVMVLTFVNIFVALPEQNVQDSTLRAAFMDVKFRPVTLALGDLLTVLISLDTIVRSNKMIQQSWDKYKKMVDVMRMDPTKFGGTAEAAAQFDKMLAELDQGLCNCLPARLMACMTNSACRPACRKPSATLPGPTV